MGRIGPDDVYSGPPLWSPDGRYIALNMGTETQRADYSWILVVRTDGRDVARVVTPRRDGAAAFAASWSPDGRRLLVQGEDARGRAIQYTIARDGSDRRSLGPRWKGRHAWSPDSSMIAFVQDGAIRVVRSMGGASRRLVSIRSSGPQLSYVWLDWSTRGELAFSDEGKLYVAVPGRNRGLPRRLTVGADPDWSPDGRRLVFSRGEQIFLVDRTGEGLRQLTEWSWEDTPKWSPDGRRVAYVHAAGFYATSFSGWMLTDVYVMAADGTKRSRIGRGAAPRWSPDGRRLVFSRGQEPADGPPRRSFVVRDLDGNGRVEITGAHPAWSPDGQQLAFVRHQYDEAREDDWVAYASTLFVARRDGSGLHRLGDTDGLLSSPQWSPDGRTIAVLGWNGNEQERTFQFVDVASGAVRTIRGREPDAFEWSPDGRRILFTECEPPRYETAVLALLDIETSSTSIVAKATGKENCPKYESFAWSPDGRRIGYIRCTPVLVEPEACDVHVMNADGSQSRRLTTTPGLERSLDW